MPRVGKKHFKYTKGGRKKAKAYAKKTGRKVSHAKKRKKKRKGGKAKKRSSY